MREAFIVATDGDDEGLGHEKEAMVDQHLPAVEAVRSCVLFILKNVLVCLGKKGEKKRERERECVCVCVCVSE